MFGSSSEGSGDIIDVFVDYFTTHIKALSVAVELILIKYNLNKSIEVILK